MHDFEQSFLYFFLNTKTKTKDKNIINISNLNELNEKCQDGIYYNVIKNMATDYQSVKRKVKLTFLKVLYVCSMINFRFF